MQFYKILEERKSVRKYKETSLDEVDISRLLEAIKEIRPLNKDIKYSFHFVKEGDEAYKYLVGNAGYYGMTIQAPHYLLLFSEVKEGALLNAGYIMEQVLLEAFQKGIGSCWMDTYDMGVSLKEKLGIVTTGEVVAIAALGYPETNVFKTQPSSSGRYSIEELVFLGEWGRTMSMEELQQYGLEEVFYYIRHAPSWGNVQPWKFIVDDNQILLTVLREKLDKGNTERNLGYEIDSGIIMLYMEKMMHERGRNGFWDLKVQEINAKKEKYNIPEDRIIVGKYPI